MENKVKPIFNQDGTVIGQFFENDAWFFRVFDSVDSFIAEAQNFIAKGI